MYFSCIFLYFFERSWTGHTQNGTTCSSFHIQFFEMIGSQTHFRKIIRQWTSFIQWNQVGLGHDVITVYSETDSESTVINLKPHTVPADRLSNQTSLLEHWNTELNRNWWFKIWGVLTWKAFLSHFLIRINENTLP